MLPLEDLYTDVIGKAQRGMGLDDEALAARCGIPAQWITNVKAGDIDETVLRKIALELNLHPAALLAMARKAWHPKPVELEGLSQFNTPFEDMTVNAYLLWDPATGQAAAFDTGADAKQIVEFVRERNLVLEAVYLTHTHPDHIQDVTTLRNSGQPVFSCHKEPWEGPGSEHFDAGREFKLGSLSIETRQTWGHSKGGVTYVVRGLKQTVAVVGDALFASSMGGGGVSYADALKTNRREILSLPDATIICPGHGPMTTIAEEKANNPFFPDFKPS